MLLCLEMQLFHNLTSSNVIRGDESEANGFNVVISLSLFHKVQDDHENDGDRIWQTLNDSR